MSTGLPDCFSQFCPIDEGCLQCDTKDECSYKHAIEETNGWIRALYSRSKRIQPPISSKEDKIIELLIAQINLLDLTRLQRWEQQ